MSTKKRSYAKDNKKNLYERPESREIGACWNRLATAARLRWTFTFLVPEGTTKAQLAKDMGVNRNKIINWCRGWSLPNPEQRLLIANHTEIAPEAIRVLDMGQKPNQAFDVQGIRNAVALLTWLARWIPIYPKTDKDSVFLVMEDHYLAWVTANLAKVWKTGDLLEMSTLRLTIRDPKGGGGWSPVENDNMAKMRQFIKMGVTPYTDQNGRNAMLKKLYGKSLQNVLQRKDIAPSELAHAIDRSPKEVKAIIDGISLPSRKTNQKIAKVVQTPAEKLEVFDVLSPAEAMSAIMDIASILGATPIRYKDLWVLDFTNTQLKKVLAVWEKNLIRLQ